MPALTLLFLLAAAASGQPEPPAFELLKADTPRTTVAGHTFIAPAGWRIGVRGPATVLQVPEGDSHIALVDVSAKDADAAVAAAWAAYRPEAKWPQKGASDSPDKDGWSGIRAYAYLTSPNEKRDVSAQARRAGDGWTVIVYDMAQDVGEKRLAQIALVLGRLLPKGYARESFAGRTAHELDAKRVAELAVFVESARETLGIPGVSIGLVQNGKVVFEGGFGVRDLGGSERVDADSLYLIASNTKPLTTLMLAKLVEEGKLKWDTPVTTLLPSFKLGSAETTRQVWVRHLVCACTGLPRQDYQAMFQFEDATAADTMATLATMQPTSGFGEMYQYSNLMAGAAGFVGGHVLYPQMELGAAYDEAMRTRVFEPLGMTSTTFDFKKALARNHAGAHAPDVDGKPAVAVMDMNYGMVPVRGAGGAWSNVRDLLKYVSMELAEGNLPGGKRYIPKDILLARRVPQVTVGKDQAYGMGLRSDRKYDVTVLRHGGDLTGYNSDMMWLPEQNVGAVILTNANSGGLLRAPFRRKLLELLFDGHPEAEADLASAAKNFFARLAAERKRLTVPADPADVQKLARRYSNEALGEIRIQSTGGATVFDFGEWKTEVASRHNPDGSVSFLTTSPGVSGLEFVVGSAATPTLVLRDAQHEYVFTERPS